MAGSELNPSRGLGAFLDRLIKSERNWLKILGAGLVGLVVAVRVALHEGNGGPPLQRIFTLIAVPLFSMLAGGILCRADTIRRQVREGKPVGMLSRLFFAAGIWSVLIWMIVTLLVGFPVAIWIGNMTFQRPAG